VSRKPKPKKPQPIRDGDGQALLCEGCERRLARHLHHIIPRSEGGSDHPENLMALCIQCHIEIHGSDFARWGQRGGRRTQELHKTYLRNLKQYKRAGG